MPKVDNYIKYLNAFYVWEQQNHLTCIQECILMRILRRVNASGWSEWIKISSFELISELRISCKNTFISNRNRLIELRLIEYKAGKKGKPSSYKLNMPERKQIIYGFEKKEDRTNISKNTPNSIPYFIPNKPETSHEECNLEASKHKTINNKLNNNINITNNKLLTCEKSKGSEAEDLLDETKYNDILLLYNTTCPKLSKVIKLSSKRKKQIEKMFSLGYTMEDFKKVFENIKESSFLCGTSGNLSWRANFDWLIKEDNFLKVLEGNYQDLSKPDKKTITKIDNSTNINDWI